jgi:hypothetical protein
MLAMLVMGGTCRQITFHSTYMEFEGFVMACLRGIAFVCFQGFLLELVVGFGLLVGYWTKCYESHPLICRWKCHFKRRVMCPPTR